MTTYLRKATSHDFPEIKKIIDQAKRLLKDDGIDQWQDGYPDDATLQEDIAQEISYVLIVNRQVAGTGVIFKKIEPAYEAIESGSWIQTHASAYVSIHRVALSSDFRGRHLASPLMEFLITAAALMGYSDIRIDTHPENPRMQHIIKQAGFAYRGIVHLDMPNGKRWAYQLLLDA
ncbi:GNAT family N-acetyltransferase [Sporolactobacillus shoreicorticis]|uniref:GNAT family N-acetyltransferase n=1 Tax=Sporolactobacillus shoreicorticis TaxID=1923877 RepID=A0ABW5S677_9BACL|nr:GNAT family N-acetyltransferase [Sporolactobacillus shoreicorticis]MCO7127139.1 GNAT family N-acetyltransferase [Sporolactobacillus shoreicorticis]